MAAINSLELSIVVSDPIFTNALKKVVHLDLSISKNLEMVQRVEVVYLVNNNGQPGIPMIQWVDENINFTREQKDHYKKVFATRSYESSTMGTMVDSKTGEEVEPGVNGAWPEGSVSELEYWQGFAPETFTKLALEKIAPGVQFYPGNTMAERIYNGLLLSALKMVQRNRI